MPKKPRDEVITNAEFDLRRRALALTARDLVTNDISESAAAKYCSGALSVSPAALAFLQFLESYVEDRIVEQVEQYGLEAQKGAQHIQIKVLDDEKIPLPVRHVIAARVRLYISLAVDKATIIKENTEKDG